jgi:peptidoglycan/LPS O-acetylase OafA/YrhL
MLPAAIVFMPPVFVIFWHVLRWYHRAAAAPYLANFDFLPPWFLGRLWSLSLEEQFCFLWPGVLKKWQRYRVAILVGSAGAMGAVRETLRATYLRIEGQSI